MRLLFVLLGPRFLDLRRRWDFLTYGGGNDVYEVVDYIQSKEREPFLMVLINIVFMTILNTCKQTWTVLIEVIKLFLDWVECNWEEILKNKLIFVEDNLMIKSKNII